MPLTPADVARLRLARQRLAGDPFAAPLDAVRALGAVQAQDWAAAKWAIAQRTPAATDADVERLLTDGAVVRTHVLRPTWHLVAAEDVRWMLALTAPRVKAAMASYDRKMGLDDAAYRRSNAAIARALRDGAHLTRTQLGEALRRARVETGDTQRLAHLVMRAELDGIACSGPRRGTQFTYALLDERVPPTAALDRDEALLALAARYFATRGPATPHDFAWWSGLTVGDARRAVDVLGPAIERVDVDGVPHWLAPPVAPPPRPRAPVAHLLPNYDELFVAYRDRAAAGERLRAVDAGAVAEVLFAHVVEIDGQFVGGWTRALAQGRATVSLHLAVEPTARERRAIADAVRRYGAFLGVHATIAG